MPRKGENIYKRKDGRWEGRYKTGSYSDGRTRYQSVYGSTYRETKTKLLERKQHMPLSVIPGKSLPDTYTIADAVNIWMSEKRAVWKPSTYATYRTIVEKHILPAVGLVPMKRFTQERYKQFLSGKVTGESPLSSIYLHQIHILMVQVFKYLEKRFRCQITKLEEIQCRKQSRNLTPPSDEAIQTLQTYLHKGVEQSNRTCLGILLSGCTGIRIGELCALQWKDFDFLRGTMHISKTMQRIRQFESKEKTSLMVTAPKSSCSDREIPLPETLLSFLKKVAGRPEDFVLIGRRKDNVEPRTLQYRFYTILKKLGLKQFNYHMLRHLFATKCLISGFDLKSLSELMGHSNVTTTMKLYIHTDMTRKRKLMNQYQMTA